MKEISGGLCAIEGVLTSGVHAGFKRKKKDFSLVYFPKGATVAGVFTKNAVKSHHILYDAKLLEERTEFKAIMTNSGNANACNGEQGDHDVRTMAKIAAKQLNIKPEEVLICSTGVIGVPMPLDGFSEKVELLTEGLNDEDSLSAVEAIMTTDTHPKQTAYEFDIAGEKVRLAAIAKGSGMIHPNLGTMLSYIVTDLAMNQSLLKELLLKAVNNSFNLVTVDGDTSPNDTVFLASTQGVEVELNSSNIELFYQALESLCQELARMLAKDGEGASKFVEVIVKGAGSSADAVSIAKTVATSSLVKTAIYGQDANWGRIISAIGQSQPESINLYSINISFKSAAGEILVCQAGKGLTFNEENALKILSQKEIEIIIEMGVGESQVQVWTCDMTTDYIKINADYRS